MIIMNMLSIFDPSTSMSLSLNWICSIYAILFIPSMYWLIPSRWNFMLIFLLQFLTEEFKKIMQSNHKLNLLLFLNLFMMILLNNIVGLMPYIFTSTSHMSFNLTFSMSMWLAYMLYGWINHTNHMFIHLVPKGTPTLLLIFMVMIETISNFMRLGSLAVRLFANILGGHIILSLISSLSMINFTFMIFSVLVTIFFMMYEMFVAMIQAYVFTILVIFYSIETS
nr:ATP synthase F0 subunit 6 [Kradibia gibbosae]